MVVVCESCETRFQLDEARIPPKGTLVRCSRCKSTFIVKPPTVDFEETVQDVVAEVTEAGGMPVPEAAEDLFETTSDDLGATLQGPDDDAWEFDEDSEPSDFEPTAPPTTLPPAAAPAEAAMEPAAAPEAVDPAPEAVDPALEASAPELEASGAELEASASAIESSAPGLETSAAALEASAPELEPSAPDLSSGLDLDLDLAGDASPEPEPEPPPESSAPEAAPETPAAPQAEAGAAFDDLGAPDDWDLLGDSVDAAASGATFVDTEGEETDPLATTASDALDEVAGTPTLAEDESADVSMADGAPAVESASLADATARARARLGDASRSLLRLGGAALRACAWGGVIAALGFGAFAVLPHGPQAVPLETRRALIPLPDGEARGVRVRFVENAFAGTLYVVEGELVRGAAEPTLGLRVQWQDTAGTALGEPRWAQPLPSDRELRERAPEAWQLAGAEGWVAPTEGRFAAIFEALPEGAAGVALRLEPLPAPAGRSVAPSVTEALHADPTASGATTPSAPTDLPSPE